MPEELPRAAALDLNATLAALEKKQTDAAVTRWRGFLTKQKAAGQPFDLEMPLGYVLNRLAAVRNPKVAEACRRLRFYDAQENAVFEHVSTIDKQLSIYGGDDLSAVPLREPELAEYGNDEAEPVTLAPGTSVGAKELQASLARWRERLPAITEAREAAIEAFVKAVRDDALLAEELHAVEVKLRAEIAKGDSKGNG